MPIPAPGERKHRSETCRRLHTGSSEIAGSRSPRQQLAELRKQWPLAFPVMIKLAIAPDRSTATLVAEILHRDDLGDCKREHHDVNAHLAC
jgi:hypothetical protein